MLPLLLVAAILALRSSGAGGQHVLLYPLSTGITSRLTNMEKISQILVRSGYQVTILINSAVYLHRPVPGNVTLLTFQKVSVPQFSDENVIEDLIGMTLREFANLLLKQQVAGCSALLAEPLLLDRLKNTSFQLFIVDYVDSCGRILVDYLDIPTILYSNYGFGVESDVFFPVQSAITPHPMSDFTDNMSLGQRLMNTFSLLAGEIILQFSFLPEFQKLKKLHNLNSSLWVGSAYQRASLVFCNTHFLFDFPRPIMPHIILVGGLFSTEGRGLPLRIERFLQSRPSAKVIVVSFGSQIRSVSQERASVMAKVFSELPELVLWRHANETELRLGNNTMTMEWLPQNDLLAQKRVSLFISHCGISSVQEALYHGVPVLALPLMIDQHHQAAKLVSRSQVAERLEFTTFTAEMLHRTVRKLIDDGGYESRMRLVSHMYRQLPVKSLEKFLYWVDQVIKHGSQTYVRSNSSLSWIQFYALDVLLIMAVLLSAAIVLIVCAVTCLVTFVRGKTGSNRNQREMNRRAVTDAVARKQGTRNGSMMAAAIAWLHGRMARMVVYNQDIINNNLCRVKAD